MIRASVLVSPVLSAAEAVQKPGRDRPLWASEMLVALCRSVTGMAVVDAASCLREVLLELREILGFQSQIRSAVPAGPDLLASFDVELGPGGGRIVVPPGWEALVDGHFRNTRCPRCSLLRTPGVAHADEQCDLDLAALVLSA